MPDKEILVSIIMATFNRGHLIGQALDSIMNQSYGNWECLIIDDGSTDSTKEVIRDYQANDKRFQYHKRSSDYLKGLPGSRNMGLDLAKGQRVLFIDDDDIVHPENLRINLEIMTTERAMFCRYEKIPFSGQWYPTDLSISNFDIRPFKKQNLPEMVTGSLAFASCTVMWDSSVFRGERFNEELHYAEEWELYTRILSKGFEGVSIDQVLYFNRKHKESNTGEFWSKDRTRRDSKVKAVKLVVDHLSEKGLLTPDLVHYFIQLGFFLKRSEVIYYTLYHSGASSGTRMIYKIGYLFYPLLRPLFLLKMKIKTFIR